MHVTDPDDRDRYNIIDHGTPPRAVTEAHRSQ